MSRVIQRSVSTAPLKFQEEAIMKPVNDQHEAQPKENAVSRKTLDEWQRRDQVRRVEAEQRDHSKSSPERKC
jgi:hypothetical protein